MGKGVAKSRRVALSLATLALALAILGILAEVTVSIAKPTSLQIEYTVTDDDDNHRLNPGVTTLARVGPEGYPILFPVNSQGLAQEHWPRISVSSIWRI